MAKRLDYESYDEDALDIIHSWYQCAFETNRPIPDKILKLMAYRQELKQNKELINDKTNPDKSTIEKHLTKF